MCLCMTAALQDQQILGCYFHGAFKPGAVCQKERERERESMKSAAQPVLGWQRSPGAGSPCSHSPNERKKESMKSVAILAQVSAVSSSARGGRLSAGPAPRGSVVSPWGGGGRAVGGEAWPNPCSRLKDKPSGCAPLSGSTEAPKFFPLFGSVSSEGLLRCAVWMVEFVSPSRLRV